LAGVARMHTAPFRANAVLTYAGSALAILALLASCTDLWHTATPALDVQLAKVERLHALDSGGDEARLGELGCSLLCSPFSPPRPTSPSHWT